MDVRVFNIQKFSIYDGPGIRTLVFFQGCPLQCRWCANPEGKSPKTRMMVKHALCTGCGQCVKACPQGCHAFAAENRPIHKFSQDSCTACGKCVESCPQGALGLSGGKMTIEEVIAEALADNMFYQVSGGGLTLGGGEPLAQPRAAAALLAAAKAAGLNTAIETCGYASPEAVAAVAPHTDVFLYDLKHMDSARHKELTGRENEPILANFAWLLNNGFKVRARMPLINGCNADLEEMKRRRNFLLQWQGCDNFLGVDLLPYHKLGIHKYAQLGETYDLDESAGISEESLAGFSSVFADAGIAVNIVRH